jgi:hypothetical protein
VKYLKHPATIIAMLALFIALGGGAAAYASGLINGSQIKNHSISAKKLTAKALKQLKGNRGPAGPAGIQGIQGIQGVQGVPGAKGDTGAIGPSNVYSATTSFVPYNNTGLSTIVSLNLGAGSYLLSGNTSIINYNNNEDTGCYLDDSNGDTLDGQYVSTDYGVSTPEGGQEGLNVTAPLTSSTAITVTLDCVTDDTTGNTYTDFAHLTAIKVGSVTGTAGHFSRKAHTARAGN